MENGFDSEVYSKNVVEFVTVANQYCIFIEEAVTLAPDDFVEKAVKLLPLLYLKSTMLPQVDRIFDDSLERFVSEEDYLTIRADLEVLMGKNDDYLEVFHPDIQYSDSPVRVKISEDLTDIYQDIKDFISLYQMGSNEIMNDALADCVENFSGYWGRKLVNVLRALHNLKYSQSGMEAGGDADDFYERTDLSNSFIARRQEEMRNEEE